ncbi:hypothetical protein [Vibrio owensii]|uniref:hypothetical protein n=1 Tax=Vibrio owensii TaxID=696485 RepID=UPI004068DC25
MTWSKAELIQYMNSAFDVYDIMVSFPDSDFAFTNSNRDKFPEHVYNLNEKTVLEIRRFTDIPSDRTYKFNDARVLPIKLVTCVLVFETHCQLLSESDITKAFSFDPSSGNFEEPPSDLMFVSSRDFFHFAHNPSQR